MERIIRQQAFEPAQLNVLLNTTFLMNDDDLPDHFCYHADRNGDGIFAACELRSPKTEVATSAILVFDLSEQAITSADVHRAYGESVQIEPPDAHSAGATLLYLSVGFDRAKLCFGFDQSDDKLVNVVLKFNL